MFCFVFFFPPSQACLGVLLCPLSPLPPKKISDRSRNRLQKKNKKRAHTQKRDKKKKFETNENNFSKFLRPKNAPATRELVDRNFAGEKARERRKDPIGPRSARGFDRDPSVESSLKSTGRVLYFFIFCCWFSVISSAPELTF